MINNLTNFSALSFGYLQEYHFQKYISLSLSSFLIIVGVLLNYSFIWNERFGSDKRRTLVNQLVSFIWKIFIFYFLVIRVCETLLSIFGPFPEWFCFIHALHKAACPTAILLTIDAIMLTRYFLIFQLKNPGRVDDDFWCTFLSIWITGVSFAFHFVWFYLPGMQPTHFYICKGELTSSEQTLPNKSPIVMGLLALSSVLLNAVIFGQIEVYKRKMNKNENTTSQSFDQSLLKDLLLCCFVLGFITTVILSFFGVNKYFQSNNNHNLNYNIFWIQHIINPLGFTLIGVAVVVKRKAIRTLIFNEIKIIFNNCTCVQPTMG